MKQALRTEIGALVDGARTAFVSSIDEDGCPNTKAMFALQRDGLFTHCFSTNLSARRSRQFRRDGRACVYFCEETGHQGLLLVGTMRVLTDRAHRAMLWRDGFERYYPKGVDDEDYCVLASTARRGNYYRGLQNTDFGPEDFVDA